MRNIILTGASDGLEKEFAKRCLKDEDINIIALCRTKPDYQCDFIKTDLTDDKSIENDCSIIQKRYNKISALINCAGVPGVQKLEEVSYDVLDNLTKINVLAPIYLTTQFISLIKESEADILNVGSTIGTKAGYTDQIAYTTSKWAMRGTSYNLQLELKKYNCRVIQFNVGGMEEDEDPIIAFKREFLEEAGCEVEVIEQLGITEEYKSLQNLKQISNIFIAKVTNDIHKLNLTKKKSEGAKLLWVESKEALELITNCYDKWYGCLLLLL